MRTMVIRVVMLAALAGAGCTLYFGEGKPGHKGSGSGSGDEPDAGVYPPDAAFWPDAQPVDDAGGYVPDGATEDGGSHCGTPDAAVVVEPDAGCC